MLKTITNYSEFIVGEPTVIKDKRIIKKEQTELNTTPTHYVETPFEKATFGMGCFWGAESLFGATPGILRTRVGYSGGTVKNPKYRQLGDHVEVIEIDFDPKIISYNDLLNLFWNNHEYGLSTKVKRQYMSLILCHSSEQRKIAEASRNEEKIKRSTETISTEIGSASVFYPAEDYHQKYRLQGHKDLALSLGINSELLQTSHVATKLNGYLVGVGGVDMFLKEADKLGLTPSQKEYVRYHLEKNAGGGLFC